ncbi:hypothetical protein T459_18552 [Capsicum annuum]|uniref:FAF domain-containing protein n=1 Tax=Capsicum annuum TaxID=4072 RepID=A0A2G2ZET0_CAPAN|nr:hypothetical protein T459_18552 [Capsicum annuum]
MNQCKHISDLLIEFNFHHYFHVFAFVDSSVKLPLDMGVHLADPSIYRRLFETGDDGLSEQHSNVDNSIGGWSFIQDLSNPKKDDYEEKEEYVHPTVKRSSNTLSIKSLEMCTESLGSETGSDISESIEEHSFFLSESENNNSHLAPRSKCKELGKKRDRITTSFPPPMPSLSRTNGVQMMRPHREGGRLILKATTVSAPKPYFKAERVDGRLRLSLLNNNTEHDENIDESDDCDRKLVSENGAYVDIHVNDNSNSDAPNDTYQSDEMSGSGDNNDDD